MGKRETGIQSRIMDEAVRLYGRHLVIRVKHGDAYATVGDPDIYGGLLGLFFGMEVKNEDGQLTKIQFQRLKEIRAAGSFGYAVRDVEDAMIYFREMYKTALRMRKGEMT